MRQQPAPKDVGLDDLRLMPLRDALDAYL
jgi:Membrane-associating domain